jgi:hypothetical protein
MRLPRMTTRRWMVVVAVVAIGFALWILGVRSRSYAIQANYHGMQEHKIRWVVQEYEANWVGYSGRWSIEALIDRERRIITYHEALKRKYELASHRPWLPVEPDPPWPK